MHPKITITYSFAQYGTPVLAKTLNQITDRRRPLGQHWWQTQVNVHIWLCTRNQIKITLLESGIGSCSAKGLIYQPFWRSSYICPYRLGHYQLCACVGKIYPLDYINIEFVRNKEIYHLQLTMFISSTWQLSF